MAEGVFFKDSEGNTVFVPQDRVQDAAANPELVPEEGQTVSFIGPNGREITTSAEEFIELNRVSPQDTIIGDEAAVASAAAADRERQFGGALGKFVAGSAGLLRGATLGGSDVVGRALGSEEELRGARDVNPGTSLATEIIGSVAPAIGTGAGGLAGSIARLTPAGKATSLATRLGARAGGLRGAVAAGGAEGAIFGAGQGVSNIMLRDEPLTAEAAVSEIGLNALVGGGFGVAGGLAGHALGRMGQKLDDIEFSVSNPALNPASAEGKVLASRLDDLSRDFDDISRTMLPDNPPSARPAGEPIFDSTAARGMDNHFQKNIDQVAEHIDNVNSGRYSMYDEVEEAVTAPVGKGTARMAPGAAAKEAKDRAAARARGDVVDAADDLRTAVGGKGKRKPIDVGPESAPKARDTFTKTADEITKDAREARKKFVDFMESKGLAKDGVVDWTKAKGLSGKDLTKADDLFSGYQSKAAKMLDDALMPEQAMLVKEMSKKSVVSKSTGVNEQAKAAIASAKSAEGSLRKALGLADDEGMNLSKIIDQSPEDAIKTITAFEEYSKQLKTAASLADGPTGKVASSVKAVEDQLQELIQKSVGREGGKLPEIAELLVIFGIEETVLPDIGGPAGDLFKLYAAHRLVKGIHGAAGGARIGWMKKAARAATSRAAGLAAAKGSSGTAGAVKYELARRAGGRAFDFVTGGTSKLAAATENSLNRVRTAMSKSLSKSGKAVRRSTPLTTKVLSDISFSGDAERKPKGKTSQELFKARSQELSSRIGNLPELQKSVHDSLAGVRQVNLGVGDKMAAHAVASVQFLYDKMPKDPGTLQQFGVSKWRPSEAELDKWARYINAVQDPAGIIERFADGKMSREDAETMRVLYPGHYAQVQDWIMSNLPEMQEKMSYAKRIQLSSLMGVPADPIVARTGTWQESFMQPEPVAPQQQAEIENNNQPTAAQMMQGVRE